MQRRERRPPPEPVAGERTADGLLVVGRVGGAYGVKGWARVVSFTDPPDNLTRYRPWYLRRRGVFERVALETVAAHGSRWVVKFAGVDSREDAEQIAGAEIAVPESVLPEPGRDEYYWKDLIGLEVVTRDGRTLGRVDRLLETGAHDILVVRTADATAVRADGQPGSETETETDVLIPFVATFIGDVDIAAGRLVVDWDRDG